MCYYFVSPLHRITEPAKADSEEVYKSINQKCEECHLDLSNRLVCVAADGASVNFGRVKGILTKFQQNVAPWMIKMHCVAHRLELSLKDAFKDTYFTQVRYLMEKNTIHCYSKGKRYMQMT